MDYENIKIEPISNGFKASVEIPKKILDLELNDYINRVDEINRLVINDKNELYIRELLNRIDKATEYLEYALDEEKETPSKYKDWRLDLLEILKGGSNG